MKNKFKYVSIVIGVALIVLGVIISLAFSQEKDKLSFHQESEHMNYFIKITITSEKDYEVNSAIVYLEDFFGDNEIVKEVSGPTIRKQKIGDDYTYTFIVEMESFSEYATYSEVVEVKLDTSIGERFASTNTISFAKIAMILMIIVGSGFIIAGIVMLSMQRSKRKYVQNIRNDMASTHPEINTNNMNDEEVLKKKRELDREKYNENGGLAGLLGLNTKEKAEICEYCGSTNPPGTKKCSSCGANLKSKK